MAGIQKTFDINLLMKDAGLVAASAAATVSAAAKVLDLGVGLMEGDVVIDATAVEVGSSDEIYTICFQVSTSATFASVFYSLASLPIGHLTPLLGDTSMIEGRYILPVNNMIADGTCIRYARLYTVVAGAIATGINYTAYLARRSGTG
jgi:hypothetical protein